MATYGGISKLYIIQIRFYLFFCFIEKVCGTKTEQSDVATYVIISKLYIIHIRIYLFFCFTEKLCGTKTEQSDVTTYGRIIRVYIYIRLRFEQPTVATYGGISKLYIIYISFISSFVSLTKYAGQKLNNLTWLRMVG